MLTSRWATLNMFHLFTENKFDQSRNQEKERPDKGCNSCVLELTGPTAVRNVILNAELG